MSINIETTTYQTLLDLLQEFKLAWESIEHRSGNIAISIVMIKEALYEYPYDDKLSMLLNNIVCECEQTPIDNSIVSILTATEFDNERLL